MQNTPIDLNAVWNAIVSTLSQAYYFAQNVLVFTLGGKTFSLLNFSIGAYFAYESISFFFGDSDYEDDGESTIDLDEAERIMNGDYD